MNKKTFIVGLTSTALLCGGCANDTQNGALIGAGFGALAGAVIGNNSGGHGKTGAAIGAGAGAIGGALIGNASDQRKQRDRQYDERHYDDRHNSYDSGDKYERR
jgi:uncharacterized protein YcfJ